MTETDLQAFADNYTSADFDKIKFDWNGQHSDKFHDKNQEFRLQLCEFLIPQLSTVRIELILDLYTELAKSAKEAWGVYTKFNLFGQELLVRGRTKYLSEYMKGATLSMDTHMASGRLEIRRELAQEIQKFLEDKSKTISDIRERKLTEEFAKRFQWLATK